MEPVFISAVALAEQWKVDADLVREFARRRDDPLPLACLPGRERGAMCATADAVEWFRRNGETLAERAEAKRRIR